MASDACRASTTRWKSAGTSGDAAELELAVEVALVARVEDRPRKHAGATDLHGRDDEELAPAVDFEPLSSMKIEEVG
ncbi:MAG: hypothetical protein H0V92_09250 [Pseudonocardiales bacterium]|nr:hypothetical protein [Pseudonocardiales bacterium]